jgi:glutathione peroxidase
VVNVASKCGLTKQYEGLEKLYKQYKDKGLVVTGFPANDFNGQEPGADTEIHSFCTMNFGVEFPMYSKIAVVGAEKHPLYTALIAAQPKAISLSEVSWREKLKGFGIAPNPEPEILWNFEKFLVSRSGQVVARFAPDTEPDAPALVTAIEAELAKS